MLRFSLTLALFAVFAIPSLIAQRGDFDNLLGDDLSQWDSVGDGVWKLTPDGILLGNRPVDLDGGVLIEASSYEEWRGSQAWLYTKKEYGEFDLHVDYFVGAPGNSGISIRDPHRARFAVTVPKDGTRTPAWTAYEIQINADWPDDWPTGSVYGLARAKDGAQKQDEWNSLNIESRNDGIRVLVNGIVVAEHPGRPGHTLTGPIGLQLHDRSSVVMFRNIWILER